ncbi:MAG: hypothetical protein A3B23_01135 [Candidatus Colwellbacteria bacterium RIFCSPLOWO2_01_FULL_48_10]|uniref:DNA-directed DNA polymerase n=1 Tax=Candidatus Colwellbacteria bacterium RIFCSPLOWO2_01_FULL_48_10 TaxID=1797690 RepID=A0A1G1Z4J5_9BACT|nr:MAG: hypothetical protein A3B23_01135 [Candidatus Colwellbacteria bacterium RIFCSPLOWO2_01_FULL_48_10]
MEAHHEGLIVLSGCFSGEVSKMLRENRDREAEEAAKYYHSIFGDDYYLEVQPESPDLHAKLIALSKKLGIPLVATQDSHYLLKEDAAVHDVLLAIQTNNRLDDEDRFSFKKHDASFRSAEEMSEAMKHMPEAIESTVKIAEKCNFEFELGKILIPQYGVPDGKTANAYLKEILETKLPERYPNPSAEVRERFEYEFSVIEKTGFADYFLIVQDFVNWARNRGIVVGPGRGSAAGSIISYILKITDVDPIHYNLLFERFLNPMRISMPDIDIDFADLRRDEVLGYLKDKYGSDRVAQIITFGTMAARASVRDAGRALGLPYAFCDRLAKLIPLEPNTDKSETKLDKYLESVPELKAEYASNPDSKKLLDTAMKLEGVARHASVHACGTVVSREPLTNYMALQRSPQDENAVITQFEMHSVEDLGLLKIDLLGLKTLTIIEETIRLLRETRNIEIEISKIPLDDKKTFELLQRVETIGVFQYESTGMRRYMKGIKPTDIEDLTVLVALYRPGTLDYRLPDGRNMVDVYIDRKNGAEKVSYVHPGMEPILKTTYGIAVYQEQMMQIARDLGGYTLPEADTLRKAIGKKIKSLLDEQGEKLTKGMIINGIDERIARKIWELFPPFARYGFNKSHSVCYALIGYQTAYLKANYPVEFMAAVLNNASDDIERIALVVNECKRMGVEVLPPDINKSSSAFVPEVDADSATKKGKVGGIRFGISAIKNIGENITRMIVEERLRGGPYQGLEDFVTRISHRDLNKKSMEALIKGGAIDSLGVERMSALENLDEILRIKSVDKTRANENQINLFASEPVAVKIKFKPVPPAPKMQRLAWEKELLGLYVTDHPLKDYSPVAKNKKLSSIAEVLKATDERKTIKTYGLINRIQPIQTKNGDPMVFAKIEDLSDNIEVLVFKDVLSKDREIWTEGNVIEISGRPSKRDGEVKIICNEAKMLRNDKLQNPNVKPNLNDSNIK